MIKMNRLTAYLAATTEKAIEAGQIFDLARQDKLTGSLLMVVHFRDGQPVQLGVMFPLQGQVADPGVAVTALKGIDKGVKSGA